jgi:hypothetical protein
MTSGDPDAQARLEHAHASTQQAAAGVQAADHRIAAVAASASIAASLSLAGAALVLDYQKLLSPEGVRTFFGWILVGALAFFTVAAAAAAFGHNKGGDVREPDGVSAEFSESDTNKRAVAVEGRCIKTLEAAQSKHFWTTFAMVGLVLGMVALVVLTVVATIGVEVKEPPTGSAALGMGTRLDVAGARFERAISCI